jgi:hypothetical protein
MENIGEWSAIGYRRLIGSHIRSWERPGDRKLLSLLVGVTKVNFMWCVFHNAQRYWSDNLCKLVTDQWRASLGVRDSESCWFTEEIGTFEIH